MGQKFKRGNKVKTLPAKTAWRKDENNDIVFFDVFPEYAGKEAIIEGSYADLYGEGSGSIQDDRCSSYSIIFCDTGNSLAWRSDNQLEFIEEGGEHLIIQAKAKREAIKKSDTNLSEIVKKWPVTQGKVSSDTILFLFDKIGFKTSFLNNGEYFILSSDWQIVFPLIDLIMTAKIEEEILAIITKNCLDEIRKKIVSLFYEVKAIKNN